VYRDRYIAYEKNNSLLEHSKANCVLGNLKIKTYKHRVIKVPVKRDALSLIPIVGLSVLGTLVGGVLRKILLKKMKKLINLKN